MLIFLAFIFIPTAIIYLAINAAICYFFLRKAESDVDLVWLMTSRKANMAASAAMIVLSVLGYIAMASAFDGNCSEHRGPSVEACGAFATGVITLIALVGMFFLFILSGLWFFGKKPEKIKLRRS